MKISLHKTHITLFILFAFLFIGCGDSNESQPNLINNDNQLNLKDNETQEKKTINLNKPISSFRMKNLNINLVKGDMIFGEDEYEGMKLINIKNPKSPKYIGNISSKGQTWNILDLNKYVLMVERNADYTHLINVDTEKPFISNTYKISAGYATVDNKSRVFFSNKSKGYIYSEIKVEIWDFSSAMKPSFIGEIRTGIDDTEETLDHIRKVAISNDIVFITNVPKKGCLAYDISNPKEYKLLGNIDNFSENAFILDGFLILYEKNEIHIYSNKKPFNHLKSLTSSSFNLSHYNQNDELIWDNNDKSAKILFHELNGSRLFLIEIDKKNSTISQAKTINRQGSLIQSFYLDKNHLYLVSGKRFFSRGGDKLEIFDRGSLNF